MIDSHQRVIDYLRVSVTDRCNLRCVYCMPEEGVESIPHDKILSFDEIVRICRVMAEDGLTKIKLTGGEPLVRRGIPSLVRLLKAIPGIEQVTITTNGILLPELAGPLVEAGIDAVTVSLDTVNRERFKAITRRDQLDKVLEGIRVMSEDHPHVPLKLNCVLKAEEEDILAVAEFARNNPIHVRYIEMMPIGFGQKQDFRNEEWLRALLESHYGKLVSYGEALGNGPAVYYEAEGFLGKFGFISAVSHKFCHLCNRVRLTSDGLIKSCLQYDIGVRLKEMMADGCSDEELKARIREAIVMKPDGHHFDRNEAFEGQEIRTMSQIGG